MTNKEIREMKKDVYEIQKASPSKEQVERIEDIAKQIGASIPDWHFTHDNTNVKSINFIAKSIHTVLQTEMMLNACASAKRSCIWAAVAAIAACISVILSLILIICSK